MNRTSLSSARPDFDIVCSWVPMGASVLDLGCGDGALLAQLAATRGTRGYGVEIDPAEVLAALERGVNVIQSDIESGLSFFGTQSFDVVILSQTLQVTRRTEALIEEVLRIGRSAIVTLPNFGHWLVRWQLGVGGRMPVSKRLPYQWYNTPNIHFSTLKDFEIFCAERGIRVLKRQALNNGKAIRWLPNLRADIAVFHLCRFAP
ncbi:MAG: methionine biosynthesis protein MetW [Casimicrobiaceae bacterium]|nr:methionine biosynthesis protein MetW [Casimicrobiaceae bacterium]MCX8097499.1 methionine biosynthesis protein MetW [Casimicrobiaceae bacterium]MDW8311217.1 methionine biosynthesis protein MetW [Burkholderiales bacterium]